MNNITLYLLGIVFVTIKVHMSMCNNYEYAKDNRLLIRYLLADGHIYVKEVRIYIFYLFPKWLIVFIVIIY